MTTFGNPFEDFGDAHARKPRQRTSTRVPLTREEKRQAEDAALAKRYRRLLAQERATAYALPGGPEARALVRWAQRDMTLEDGDDLLARTRRLRPERMPKLLRHRLLADLDEAICRLRVRSGHPEFDDPLPDEPDSVFIILKRLLS